MHTLTVTDFPIHSLLGTDIAVMKKQKIVMEVPIYDKRHKSKAMRVAASIKGVSGVSIESETNKIVVMGDGVDPVELALSLKKKFDYAKLLTVEEVKPSAEEKAKSENTVKTQYVVFDPVIGWHHPSTYPYPFHAPSSSSCNYL